jgi:hypothetical protein
MSTHLVGATVIMAFALGGCNTTATSEYKPVDRQMIESALAILDT